MYLQSTANAGSPRPRMNADPIQMPRCGSQGRSSNTHVPADLAFHFGGKKEITLVTSAGQAFIDQIQRYAYFFGGESSAGDQHFMDRDAISAEKLTDDHAGSTSFPTRRMASSRIPCTSFS